MRNEIVIFNMQSLLLNVQLFVFKFNVFKKKKKEKCYYYFTKYLNNRLTDNLKREREREKTKTEFNIL